jgi:hypothetical protein
LEEPRIVGAAREVAEGGREPGSSVWGDSFLLCEVKDIGCTVDNGNQQIASLKERPPATFPRSQGKG